MANLIPNRTCEKCRKNFYIIPSRIVRGHGRFCSKKCLLSWSLRDRFFSYVGEPTKTGCVIWKGTTGKLGYGRIGAGNGDRRILTAHRVAWELAYGPIPEGMDVLHNCPGGDNPSCVAIAHLWLGTQADNMADAAAKGRTAKGEGNGKAILTEKQVCEIIRRYQTGDNNVAIADVFGVSVQYVWRITSGRTWKHLPR